MRTGLYGSLIAVAACIGSLSSCVRHPSTEIRGDDPNYGHRWHASVVTPASLAGVAQVTGDATWSPGSGGDASMARLRLQNATPGGVHPWAFHQGRCGSDQGIVASPDRYPPLRVGRDGVALQTAPLPVPLPLDGQFFVSVQASNDNIGTTIACGNLSPPVR
jgi:hypothetical protein